jgi:hypothetical protein
MAMTEPLWTRARAALGDHEEMRRRHRADGVVTPEEDRAEARHLRLVAVAAVESAADADDIAQAVRRGGPECQRARRLMRDRARRLGLPVPFPGDRFGLADGDAVQLEAA